ncbi:MAG: helix-turn-helix domain-containing protein [Bacteroidaceae bacterium]|nr:helix-turn-helix domain-containing protein [Bacteroidaceae bacterium]
MNNLLNRKLLFQNFAASVEPDVESYIGFAAGYAIVEGAIAVLSDLKKNESHIFYGNFGSRMGLSDGKSYRCITTIWETDILDRIDKSDIERKQLDELQFFDFVKRNGANGQYYMENFLSMRDSRGELVMVRHRIFYIAQDAAIRFALCLYTPAVEETPSSIVDSLSGGRIYIKSINTDKIISERERTVLQLIDEGLSSKEIAKRLNISVHTVSRHRQNILDKLRARNSSHAIKMAKGLKLV